MIEAHVKTCPFCAAHLVEQNYGLEHPSAPCVLSQFFIQDNDQLAAWQDVGIRKAVLIFAGIDIEKYVASHEANEAEVMRNGPISVNAQRSIFSAMGAA